VVPSGWPAKQRRKKFQRAEEVGRGADGSISARNVCAARKKKKKKFFLNGRRGVERTLNELDGSIL